MKAIAGTLLFFLGALPIHAQEPPRPLEPKTRVEQKTIDDLVTRLADRDFQVREKADQDLRALGRDALPLIEKHLNDQDAEVRMRLKAIVESLKTPAEPAPAPEAGIEPLRPIRPGQRLEVEDGDVQVDLDVAPAPRPRREDFDSDDDFRRAVIEWRDRTNEQARSRVRVFTGTPGIGQSIVIGPGGAAFQSSKSIFRDGERLTFTQGGNGVSFRVESRDGGKTSVSAPDFETFKKDNAELYERYKGTGIFEDSRISFDVLRPDAPDRDLSQRERALHERLERLLDLNDRDLFDDFNQRFRDMMKRNEELDRSLRERLDALLGGPAQRRLFDDLDAFRGRRPAPAAVPRGERLGLMVGPPPAAVAARLDREKLGAAGVFVSEVTPGSLAETMGLEPGDVLLRLGTTALNEPRDLIAAFQAIGPGEKVSIGLLRGEETLTLSGTKPGERKPDEAPKKLEKLDERDLRKF